MNIYVNLINETIEYIEKNINEQMSLEEISKHFCISKFHFNRMFKTVTGITLKQYVLGRKLTEALGCLTETEESIINVAYRFGFEYPEVFSRAFKKQFGIPPSSCRTEKIDENLIQKANIVERDIINYKGTLTLDGAFIHINDLLLEGTYVEVDTNNEEFKSLMTSTGDKFLESSKKAKNLDDKQLYTVVSCHGQDNGEYTVFYGMKSKIPMGKRNFEKCIIPQGWYTRFIYTGDMFDIREAFIDDLYRWIMVKDIELSSNGVGMVNIFDKDYFETNEVQILVPIKNPYIQQEIS